MHYSLQTVWEILKSEPDSDQTQLQNRILSNNTVKKLTDKFSQLLFSESTTVQPRNLPNYSFSYFFIRFAPSKSHAAFKYANISIDDPSFLHALHEGPLGFQAPYRFRREISGSIFSLFRPRWLLPLHNRVQVPTLSICS